MIDPAAPSPTPGVANGIPSVILGGGRAKRLGTPKPGVLVAGRSLLRLALDVVDVSHAVVVGPEDLAPQVDALGARLTREQPPFGGPVAAIAAGLGLVPEDAEWVLVLACDIPRAGELIPALLQATESASGNVDAFVVEHSGQAQWLLGVYRRAALESAVGSLRGGFGVDGAAVRTLVAGLHIDFVDDSANASHDIDTASDLEIAERHLATGTAAH